MSDTPVAPDAGEGLRGSHLAGRGWVVPCAAPGPQVFCQALSPSRSGTLHTPAQVPGAEPDLSDTCPPQPTPVLTIASHLAPALATRTKENGLDRDPLGKRPCTLSPAQRYSPSSGLPPPTPPPPHYRLEDMALAHHIRDPYRHSAELRERHRQLGEWSQAGGHVCRSQRVLGDIRAVHSGTVLWLLCP